MPDWRAEVRCRLEPFALRPTREMEIVEEISQHWSFARGASTK